MDKNTTIDLAVNLIAKLEGFKEHAYQDGAGVWTLGFGQTTINDRYVKSSDSTTEQEAKAWLRERVTKDYEALDDTFCKSHNINLTDNEAASVLSFIYNVGCYNFMNSSIATDLINNNKDKVKDDLLKWDKIRTSEGLKFSVGLYNRRMAEYKCFINNSTLA